MSLDMDVLPLCPELPPWGLLAARWSELASRSPGIAGTPLPQLEWPGDRGPVAADERLRVGFFGFFTGSPYSTLSLSVRCIESDGRRDFVEDYGRNLSEDEQARILDTWTGAILMMSSRAGRPEGEFELLRALASALAISTDGWVVLPQEAPLGLRPGMYRGRRFLTPS